VPGFVVLYVQSLQESAIEAVKEQLTEVNPLSSFFKDLGCDF
jgi:hypothetical protein